MNLSDGRIVTWILPCEVMTAYGGLESCLAWRGVKIPRGVVRDISATAYVDNILAFDMNWGKCVEGSTMS